MCVYVIECVMHMHLTMRSLGLAGAPHFAAAPVCVQLMGITERVRTREATAAETRYVAF